MTTQVFRVHLGGNKLRDVKEVKAFAQLVEVKGVLVKSLHLTVNSIGSLEVQRTLLELQVLSRLETLTIIQDLSLGASCVDTLVEAVEAGHIGSLQNLDLRFTRQDIPGSRGGATPSPATPQASPRASTVSRSVPSLRSAGTNSQIFTPSVTSSQSFVSTSTDSPQESPATPVSWKGFASLAGALRNGRLPNLKAVELKVNFDSTKLGDEGAEGLAELIKTGKLSSMKELNLENNSIGISGIEALGKALRCGNLPHLTLLNLSRNNFQSASEDSSSGLMELILALEENRLPSLESIGLSAAGQHSTPTSAEAFYGKSVAEAIVEVYTRNTALTAAIDIDWPERALEARWNTTLQRNVKLTEILKTLNTDGADVSVTNGKIFICGFPGVGKTTLRKSLKRPRWRAIVRSEVKLRHEIPTRGIEVSHIKGRMKKSMKGTLRLTLWDLAGQEEFHVLHSSFLPDLGMANGKATTFVVVLNARYNRSADEASAEEELTYWLRFIASNSITGKKRNVVVVLNTFRGGLCREKPQWCELVSSLRGIFEDILYIQREPIVLDARLLKSVKQLKTSLFEHTGSVLHGLLWPKVCQYIQRNLQKWAKENQNFPVIHWNDFTGKMAASKITPEKLEAAVEYLHETGDLIYFREGSLKEEKMPDTRLIVLDPQWFCKRIVGELLLPDEMVREGERALKKCVASDGSLLLREIKAYFNDLLKNSPQVTYVVGMLIRLGLCYKVGDDKVLIPSLVEEDELPGSWSGRGAGGHWVMGRSLALKDTERTALPKSLFRRLQVLLAQDVELGGNPNSDYTVGKSYLTFKKSGMLILVQCDVHEDDPRDDRIDMIAKPLFGRDSVTTQRKKQIELVEVVMERLRQLCFEWCPGLKFVQKVILPWSDSEGAKPMLQRNTKFTLDDIRRWIQHNGLGSDSGYSDLNHSVDGEEVREDDLLSSNEIDELQKKMWVEVNAKKEKLKQLVNDLALEPEPSMEQIFVEETLEVSSSSVSRQEMKQSDEPASTQEGTIPKKNSISVDTEKSKKSRRLARKRPQPLEIKKVIEKEGQKTRQHMNQRINEVDHRISEVMQRTEEVGDNFRKTFRMQRLILQKVQNLGVLSLKQMEVMVPRYMYLADRSGAWMSLRTTYKTDAHLHLLCEARYNDGVLHAVDGQRGVEISKLKDWASKIAPWLENSLKVTIVVAQMVGGILIPGLSLLFPDMQKKEGKDLLEMLAKEVMTPDAQGSTMTAASRRCTAMELNDRAKHILKSLLGEPLESEVFEKFGLKRVMFQDASPRIAWICNPCYRKYVKSDLVRDVPRPYV